MRKKISLSEIQDTAVKAARKAGKVILSCLDDIRVDFKGSNNMVTNADRGAEAEIVSFIRKLFPDHAFFCEEADEKAAVNSEHLWIIDPLDGTNNYARKIPQFCVSIAYAQKGEVLAGVVLDPCRKEIFTSVRGKGAFLNNKRIHVSKTPSLNTAIIATGFYYDRGHLMERTLEAIHALFKKNICGFRRMGSAALDICWVACGRYDGYFEYMLSPWDYAAGMLILREAGGVCLDREGSEKSLANTGIISHNALIGKEFEKIVRFL